MNLQEIKDYIREYLVNKSGLNDNQVIFDFQNAPKPNQDFIMLNPTLNIRNVSRGEFKNNNTDGTVTIIQRKEIDMSINCYGSNSEAIMNDILDSFSLPENYQDFDLNNIVITSNDSIRNLSFIENNQWVKRFQLDLTVKFIKEVVQDLGYFETIGISGEIEANSDFEAEHYDILTTSIERDENNNDVSLNIIESIVEHEQENTSNLNVITSSVELETDTFYTQRNVIDLDINLESNPSNIETFSSIDIVSNVSINSLTTTSFNISWNNPINTGEYIIEISDDNFSTILDTVTGLGNNYTFIGLSSNTGYQIKIYSVTFQGISDSIDLEIITKPVAPTIQAETNLTSNSFNANWILPVGINQVKLYVSSDDFATNDILNGVTVTGSTYSVTGLTASTTYKYKVKSIGINSDSDFSSIETVLTESNLVEKIIYCEQAVNGNYRLVKANPDNTSKSYLTPDTYSSLHPSASNDGTKIVFTKEYSASKSDLMILDLVTNTITNLTNFATNNNYVWNPSFNNDDTKILYAYHAGSRSATAVIKEMTIATLSSATLYTASGTNDNISPEYNTDNTKLYFSNTSGLVLFDIATSGITIIDAGNEYFATQHPTQNKIIYSSSVGGINYKLVERDLDINTVTEIYPAYSYNMFARYSPDGNSVIWSSLETGIWQIKKKNLITNAIVNLTSGSIHNLYPEFAMFIA